jgi:hypothetical protein
MASLLPEALRLRGGRLSVIPVLADGTERPAIPWKSYQARLPTPDELWRWFRRSCVGLAIIGGDVSERLEIPDFDDSAVFTPWATMVETFCPSLLATPPIWERAEALRRAVEVVMRGFRPALPARPEAETEPVDEEAWLFDGQRPYPTQLAIYKAHRNGYGSNELTA